MKHDVTEASNREGRESGHNRPSNENIRIRHTGWLVALIFLVIGLAAAYLISIR